MIRLVILTPPYRFIVLVLLVVLAACSDPSRLPDAPAAPSALVAEVEGDEVRLSWEASSDAVGYYVYRSDAPEDVKTPENRLNAAPEPGTSYRDAGLGGGVTYYYLVTAVDASGRESAAQPQAHAVALPAGQLAWQPAELVFSSVQGETSASQSLTLSNQNSASAEITRFELEGEDASAFVFEVPALPLTLEPGGEVELELAFAPADAQLGSLSATLAVETASGTSTLELYGLSAQGRGGTGEPTLQEVVDTLGFAIDIGSDELEFGVDPSPLGDEVTVQRFRRAAPGEVGLRPVARYSPDERVPFGYYLFEDTIRYLDIAQIDAGQDQTLNPAIAPGGQTSFDPGEAEFGVFVRSEHFRYTTHSEDHLNTNASQLPRAVRVYPLKDRVGNAVAGSYLLAFEDFTNGDFQDYVFVLSNVEPATGGPTPEAQRSDVVLVTENLAGMVDGELQTGFFNDWLSFSTVRRIPADWPEGSDWSALEVKDVASLRLRNEGSDELTVSAFDIAGPHAQQFVVRSQENPGLSLPFAVAPGEFRDINVRFLGGANQEGEALLAPRPPFCPPRRAQVCGELRRATLTIQSNAEGGAVSVELAGAHQMRPEWIHENSLTQLAMVFGYSIDIGEPLVESGDSPLAGDEVRAPFWTRADSDEPVYVRQLAAFHGCCLSLDWFDLGPGTHRFFHHPHYGQSIFPPLREDLNAPAQHRYTSPPARFEIRSGTGGQVYTTNVDATASGNLGIRMWPVRDRDGTPLPNTYLIAQDYVDAQPEQDGCGDGAAGGLANCDYNDNVYLISNIMPAP